MTPRTERTGRRNWRGQRPVRFAGLLGEQDADRLVALNRMKRLATGLLIVMALIFSRLICWMIMIT